MTSTSDAARTAGLAEAARAAEKTVRELDNVSSNITGRCPPELAERIANWWISAAAGGIPVCPHVDGTGPAFWDAGMPTKFVCAPCMLTSLRHPRRNPGCHNCGVDAPIAGAALALPGLLGHLADGRHAGIPPAVCIAAVCRPCWGVTV